MSIWHIKDVSQDQLVAKVVMHIDVPAGNNDGGIPWQQAVSEFKKPLLADGSYGVIQSKYQGIGAEITDLQNGSKIEVEKPITFLITDSDLDKQNKINALFTTTSTEILAELAITLKFWGLSG